MHTPDQRVIDGCQMIKKQMEYAGIEDWGRLRSYFNISYDQVQAIRDETIEWTILQPLLEQYFAFWNLVPPRY